MKTKYPARYVRSSHCGYDGTDTKKRGGKSVHHFPINSNMKLSLQLPEVLMLYQLKSIFRQLGEIALCTALNVR